MKIIHDDRVSSIAVTQGALGTHTVDLVQNDRPRQSFISSAISETITFQIDANATHSADGFFLHGGLFDSGSWDLQTTGGSSIENGALTVDFAGESDLGDNPNTLNTYFQGTSNLIKPEFVTFTTSQTADCQLVLQLTSSTDRRDQNTIGNPIASWVKDTGTTGRFLDSDTNAVNVINHGLVFIGSFLKISGAVLPSTAITDTTVSVDSVAESVYTVNSGVTVTVNSGITLLISNFLYAQITSIVGDGTTTGAITVDQDVTTLDIEDLVNPNKLGVFRCGSILDLPNPQVGAMRQLTDYSVKRLTQNGGMNYTNRNTGQNVSLSLMATNSEARDFEDFCKVFRSKPFPVLWAASMLTAQNEETRYSGFFYLTGFPSFTLLPRAAYQSINCTLTELL